MDVIPQILPLRQSLLNTILWIHVKWEIFKTISLDKVL